MAYQQLTYGDRISIGVLKQQGNSPTKIAHLIGKDRSSIYREFSRNSTKVGYFPEIANTLAQDRKSEAAAISRIDEDEKKWIIEKLRLQWSPEQISNRMKLELGVSISHEWIYQMVYEDRKNGGDLYLHLRWGRKTRKKRGGGRDKRGQIPNRVSIDQRPQIINDRGRLGDLEGDTIIGSNQGGNLLTLVDRKSRFTLIEKLENKTAEITSNAIIHICNSNEFTYKSITFDNGTEFTDHEKITNETGFPIYFAHPYCSNERGTNENTNGLIRQYFPKKTDFSKVSQNDVKKVQHLINHRPRRVLNFKSAYEIHSGETLQYFFSNSVTVESL